MSSGDPHVLYIQQQATGKQMNTECGCYLQFLLPDYSSHFALLVTAMHILLRCNVLKEDVDAAHEMLETFITLCHNCIQRRCCYQAVIHLSRCVHELEPLWAYSCFGFENILSCMIMVVTTFYQA